MENASNDRLEEIFSSVLGQPEEERDRHIEQMCGGDQTLLQRVETLLREAGSIDLPLMVTAALIVTVLAFRRDSVGKRLGGVMLGMYAMYVYLLYAAVG